MEPDEKKKLDDIHRAVVGNPLDPDAPQGILARLEEHHVALFGCAEQRQKGLVEKVQELWDWRLKTVAICAALGGLGAWLLPQLFRVILAALSAGH